MHIQPPIEIISGALSRGFKPSGRDFEHLPASSDYETVDLYRHIPECYHCVYSENL